MTTATNSPDTKAPVVPTKPGSFTYTAGLDIGNGYVKGIIENRGEGADRARDELDLPSVAATITSPSRMRTADAQAAQVTGERADWYNNVDVTFNSPLVGDTHRHLIGTRALTATSASLDEFRLVGHTSKAQQDLSKVLVLGVLAARAVADYAERTGELPGPDSAATSLSVRATVALALPINEYIRHRDSYAAGFLGTSAAGSAGAKAATHMVTVGNFETSVSVVITFDDVMVLPEGTSAQWAIVSHGEGLMNHMLADVRSHGVELDAAITAADLLGATNTLGVDVGEGTVNFPVMTGGSFNSDASRSMGTGYGTVLENALADMENKDVAHGFTGRKQLADFLNNPPPLKANLHAKVKNYVDEAAAFFVKDVAVELARALQNVGALTEVIYVYGGGSGPLRDLLYPELMRVVREMNSDDAAPVLYLDSAYSRGLNREGLIIAARNRAERAGRH